MSLSQRTKVTGQSTVDMRKLLWSQDQLVSNVRDSTHHIDTLFMSCAMVFYNNYIQYAPYTKQKKPGMPQLDVPRIVASKCPHCGGSRNDCSLCAVMGALLGMFCGGLGVRFCLADSPTYALANDQTVKYDMREAQNQFMKLVFGTYRRVHGIRGGPCMDIPDEDESDADRALRRQLPNAYSVMGPPYDPTYARQIDMEDRANADILASSQSVLPLMAKSQTAVAIANAAKARTMSKVTAAVSRDAVRRRAQESKANAKGIRKALGADPTTTYAIATVSDPKTVSVAIASASASTSPATVTATATTTTTSQASTTTTATQGVEVEVPRPRDAKKRQNTTDVRLADRPQATHGQILAVIERIGVLSTGSCDQNKVSAELGLSVDATLFREALRKWKCDSIASFVFNPVFSSSNLMPLAYPEAPGHIGEVKSPGSVASASASTPSATTGSDPYLERLLKIRNEFTLSNEERLAHFFRFCRALRDYKTQRHGVTDEFLSSVLRSKTTPKSGLTLTDKRIAPHVVIGDCVLLAPRMIMLCAANYPSLSFFERNAGQIRDQLRAFQRDDPASFDRKWAVPDAPSRPVTPPSPAACVVVTQAVALTAARPSPSPYPASLQTSRYTRS